MGVTGGGCLARPCATGIRNSNLYWDWFFERAHGRFLGQDILNGSAPWCSRLHFFTKACHCVLSCVSSENSCVRASGRNDKFSAIPGFARLRRWPSSTRIWESVVKRTTLQRCQETLPCEPCVPGTCSAARLCWWSLRHSRSGRVYIRADGGNCTQLVSGR